MPCLMRGKDWHSVLAFLFFLWISWQTFQCAKIWQLISLTYSDILHKYNLHYAIVMYGESYATDTYLPNEYSSVEEIRTIMLSLVLKMY